MSGTTADPQDWTPWRVAPDSGFETVDPDGNVGIVQIDPGRFLVVHPFRFADAPIEADLVAELVDGGLDPGAARRAVNDARPSPRGWTARPIWRRSLAPCAGSRTRTGGTRSLRCSTTSSSPER